jgi:hypothetical protein
MSHVNFFLIWSYEYPHFLIYFKDYTEEKSLDL